MQVMPSECSSVSSQGSTEQIERAMGNNTPQLSTFNHAFVVEMLFCSL